jgi:PAS domain S-box-containing protein
VNWNGRLAELVSARDVSALFRLNRRLEDATELLRIAGRIAKVGGWRASLDGSVEWSPETAAIHEAPDVGHVPVERGIDYYAPEYRDRIRAVFGACARDGTPFDEVLQIVTAAGNRVWVRSIGEPERDASGAICAVRGAFQDVSELVAAREQSEQLSRRLLATLESISDAFYTLDANWRFTYVNRRAEELLERRREDLLGRQVWAAFPEAADAQVRNEYERAVATGDTVRFTMWYAPLAKWFQIGAHPSPEGLAVYFTDVTQQREADDRLRQSQKLEAVGQLTGGVAHDFNNLLTVMLGSAEMLASGLADRPKLHALASTCVTAAERGAELTSRLLAFARRQALEPRATDVAALVRGMGGLLRRTLAEDIDIRMVADDDAWHAEVDPGQLEVALLNLAINARDAMPHGGRLTIEAAIATLDEEYAAGHPEVRPGDYVAVSVSDTGTGMAPEVLARAFEPFFTTKQVGKGSGLGLSMVYGFVRQSGGHAKIYTEPGHGTTVRLYFPRATKPDAAEVLREDLPVVGGHEHVLVVEDDALVREHAVALLLGLGYRVTCAADGAEALEILRGTEPVDLLFTDVVMPGGLNGRELADAAQVLRPGLKVLYTSGYTENAIVHHGRLDRGVQLLGKPYRRQQLAQKVRAVLDAPGTLTSR